MLAVSYHDAETQEIIKFNPWTQAEINNHRDFPKIRKYLAGVDF